jgi:cytosine deaminase
VPDPSSPDDVPVQAALQQAVKAARSGNFGIGAVLVDSSGKVLLEGRNRVFTPRFRSDAHAEMDVLSKLERLMPEVRARSLTLYTSVECCPMCLARVITSGISRVVYVATDADGGMVAQRSNLPRIWRDLSKGQRFDKAKCSPELTRIADEVFRSNVVQLDRELRKRR